MGGKTQGILVQSHVDNKPLLCCGTEKGDYTAGHTRGGAVRDGFSSPVPRAHPHTLDGFKVLRATGLSSPAKQRQRGDRTNFHIKGMEAWKNVAGASPAVQKSQVLCPFEFAEYP